MLHNANPAYTTHILKTEHDTGLMENNKNLEKLVKKGWKMNFWKNIFIYIYIYIYIYI